MARRQICSPDYDVACRSGLEPVACGACSCQRVSARALLFAGVPFERGGRFRLIEVGCSAPRTARAHCSLDRHSAQCSSCVTRPLTVGRPLCQRPASKVALTPRRVCGSAPRQARPVAVSFCGPRALKPVAVAAEVQRADRLAGLAEQIALADQDLIGLCRVPSHSEEPLPQIAEKRRDGSRASAQFGALI
jgi:hypothetical protein